MSNSNSFGTGREKNMPWWLPVTRLPGSPARRPARHCERSAPSSRWSWSRQFRTRAAVSVAALLPHSGRALAD